MSDPDERARKLAGPDGQVTQAGPASPLATADPTGAPGLLYCRYGPGTAPCSVRCELATK